MSFVVRMRRSALPFWGEVWGQERGREAPYREKRSRREVVRDSAALSHSILWMATWN